MNPQMTTVDEFLHDVSSNEGLLMQFRSDPEEALEKYKFEDEEARQALLDKDESRIRKFLSDLKMIDVVVVIYTRAPESD